jgi:nucleoid-associated protein YgaU
VTIEGVGVLLPPGVTGQMPETPQDLRPSLENPTGPSVPLPTTVNPITVEVAPAKVTVQSGDNLWVLCRRHLTSALGRRPASGEIAPYWQKVIARNQPDLISGNPDLIYPGEVIEMPPF